MATEKSRPINPRSYTLTAEALALLELTRPLKIEYDALIRAELDKPGGGSLKNFLNFRDFLKTRLNKTTKEIIKLEDTLKYHGVRPKLLLADAKKQLLQKLIKLDNEKPGRPSQHWKLAEQAGYAARLKSGKHGAGGSTAPSGSFKNLLSIEKKVLNRVDDVIKNLDQMSIDELKRDGGIYRHIGKGFGIESEAVQVYMRKFPKKYKTARIDLEILQNPNTLNKYSGRGMNVGEVLVAYEAGKGGVQFSEVVKQGPVKKIMQYAGRHIEAGGQLITKLDDNSFVYNNKIFSTDPDAVSLRKVLVKRGLHNSKVIDLVKDAHKQPEFKEIFKVFDELKEIEKIKRPHPLTGKMTPLVTLIKEADNIAYPGRKDAWSKTGLALDHFSKEGIKGTPFEGLRVSTRSLNEAAGQFTRGFTALQPEFGKKAMGYSFKGNILPSLYTYIDNTITKGVARPGKMEAAKLRAAGLSGEYLTSEIDPKFFDKAEGRAWERFKGKYTRVPILEKATEGYKIGSRLPTGSEPRFGVAQADSMYAYLRELLTKTKKGTPAYNKVCGIGTKIMHRYPQASGGRTGYKAAGVVGSCPIIPALEAAPEQTMNELSKLKSQTGVLGRIGNTARGFLGALGKFGPAVGKFGALAAAGALAKPAYDMVRQFRNDDPATYLTDPEQMEKMLLSTIEAQEQKKPRSEILDWGIGAGAVGATAAAVPGTGALWKARRAKGMGMPRASLGPVGKFISGAYTPAGLLAHEPLRIAQMRREGESWGEIAQSPTLWMGPAFADTMTRMATRGMRAGSPLAKGLSLGMSRPMLKTVSRRFGMPGLALSAGLSGYDLWKDYKKKRGFFASDED